MSNDTLKFVHVALPATAWGEKDGTVTNSERRISRQRRFLPSQDETRGDWRIVAEVAQAMGYHGFKYASAAAVFREHAALSGFENGGRAFDISAFAELSNEAYDALAPVQWPFANGANAPTARVFGDGGFLHPDGRARLVPVTPRPPRAATTSQQPLVLNSGRVRDHWHTMTRTGRSARLSNHVFEPYAEMHPQDARRCGVDAGDLARLTSAQGEMIARVRVSAGQRRGCVFAPMHWSDELAGAGRVNALTAANVDPLSGQPEFKQTPVALAPYAAAWRGFALTRERVRFDHDGYWALVRGEGHWRQELAGLAAPASWEGQARAWLGEGGDWIAFRDPGAGRYRFARITNGRLDACLFVGADVAEVPRAWLGGLFAQEILSAADRLALLVGRAADGRADAGALVCACFGVGEREIDAAIAAVAASVEAVGKLLKAGTNCGSCKSEIARRLRPIASAA